MHNLTQLCFVAEWLYTAVGEILSPGDDLLKAPDPILIEPRVEPISEVIKYKLFALTVLPVDVFIKDSGTLTRIQVTNRAYNEHIIQCYCMLHTH